MTSDEIVLTKIRGVINLWVMGRLTPHEALTIIEGELPG